MTWTAPTNGLSATAEALYGELRHARTSPSDLQPRPINRSGPSQSNLEYIHNLEFNHNPQTPIGSLPEPINLIPAF